MREYIRFQFEHTETYTRHSWPTFGMFSHLLSNMNARHVLHEIADHDDHLLKDMGITRADVETASHTFITKDAVSVLDNARKLHFEEEGPPKSEDGLRSTNLRHII